MRAAVFRRAGQIGVEQVGPGVRDPLLAVGWLQPAGGTAARMLRVFANRIVAFEYRIARYLTYNEGEDAQVHTTWHAPDETSGESEPDER